jgi:hypothetical protein
MSHTAERSRPIPIRTKSSAQTSWTVIAFILHQRENKSGAPA